MKASRVIREWHRAHRMVSNPAREERVAWHAEHAAECGCRPVPANIAADVEAFRSKRRRGPSKRAAAPKS